MNWIRAGTLLVVLGTPCAPAGSARAAAPACAADFASARAAARAGLVTQLEGYVDWCQGKSLFNEKKKALELLLELVPGHAEALKVLGYTRQKDGVWKAPKTPKVFRDFDKEALAEAGPRWRETTAGYVQAMLALLESGALVDAEQAEAAREALRFDPDNARVHALLGEVHSEQGWVLPASVRAKERREELRGLVRAALEGVPAALPAPLLEREQRIPLPLEAVAAPRLRVVGTAAREELLLTAQAVQALERLLQAVFASPHALPADTTVFLLADPAQRADFIAHHPAIAPEQRAYYERLEGGGIQGTNDFASWSQDTQHRIDASVRLALGYWLSGAYRVTVEHGWVYEGFGLYLTRALVRSRTTWMAQPSKVLAPELDLALRQKLLDPATNWMDEALRLYVEGRQPALPELFSKDASQLTTEDVLLANALATYLLEARPEVVSPLMARLGKDRARTQAFQEVLGMDLARFQAHLQRWLGERK